MIEIKNDHRIAHVIGMSMLRQGVRVPRSDAEVLVAKEPSTRTWRRQRQRDLAAMGRKSRRTAFQNDLQQRYAEQNVRGQARVYLQGTGTPAMRENVRREIHGLAGAVAGRNDEAPSAALKRVEGELMKSLALHGDDI